MRLLCVIGFCTLLVFIGESLDFAQEHFPYLLWAVPGAALVGYVIVAWTRHFQSRALARRSALKNQS
jgi:hypothetical protein